MTWGITKKEVDEFHTVTEALAEKMKESQSVLDEIIELQKQSGKIEIAEIRWKTPIELSCVAWLQTAMAWRAIALTKVDKHMPFSEEIKDAEVIETKAWEQITIDLKCKLIELEALVETNKHIK